MDSDTSLQFSLGQPGGECDDPFVIAPPSISPRPDPVALPAGQTVSDTIFISDVGAVVELELELDLDNGYMGDLWVELLHGEERRTLFIDLGSQECQAPNMTVKFTQDAVTGIQEVCPGGSTTPIVGDYRPNQSLEAFYGLDVNGIWELRITDQYFEDGGTLNGWTLIVNGGIAYAANGFAVK